MMLVVLYGTYVSHLEKKHSAESGTIVPSLFMLIFLQDICYTLQVNKKCGWVLNLDTLSIRLNGPIHRWLS